MIRIRQATAGDEACVAEIIRASMLASYAHFLPEHQFRKILDMDRPARVARENASSFSLAEVGGAPAGALLLKENYVDHLWVRPEFMGLGVGSALLDHAEDRARRAGFGALTLDCLERNKKALSFYQTKGFAVERTYVATNYLAGENVRRMLKPL
ncbi:putative N-acetyltransferase YjaB [Pseudodesulfovibrio hydrargyri]|uniref:Putative N-acetyltransferase YjaB n=1 Tax=Pseudodesulfovibrio hydrargyri TaxID=2125990 RepID=A0A1J5MSU6_9BACT|nr:GNAT family N-acetyltransferase [Pseudodesulfovibrio hydrargyri]OIQ49066.1 putative N-acetyltransferase YjaB [Pseudodesulfovibrio hydrargyri]